VSGEVKRKAKESAERCVPLGIQDRPRAVSYYVDGYMAGHAAHTRWFATKQKNEGCNVCGGWRSRHYSDCSTLKAGVGNG
jgi:hypothetical protein